MLAVAGILRLGTFIKFIPFPVIVGFTAGIAVIIFASQIRELFGLSLTDEPGELLEKIPALWKVRGSVTEGLAHKARQRGVTLWLTGASRDIRRVFLVTHGLRKPLVRYAGTVEEAMAAFRDEAVQDSQAA